ncbi:MAG: PDZ domain-containing protein [Bacteriovorax sp.]|nr:PDZ domain-containing protein [Bacteriovorax sp.]
MKMSKSALLTLAISTLLSAQSANAGLFTSPIKNIQINGAKDVYAGLDFHYFDRDDRLLIINDFLKTVELEYALLPLKKSRIGLDFKKLKAEAIDRENASESILIASADRSNLAERSRVSFLQAKANMEFLDRMQALAAQFQDTHFSVQEKIARPFVYTGVRMFRIDGKVVVGSIEKKFMAMASKLSGTDYSRIAIGDEVIAINGKPVEDRVNELKKYVSGSSDEFIDYQAIRALTIRNHNYDSSNSVTITFRDAGVFKLPLFANRVKDSTPRLDALTFFNKMGIPSDSTTIGMSFDKSSKQWIDGALSYEGYTPVKLHLNLKGLTELLGDDGTPALRTGYYISKGKSYGVLQILTFMTKNVKVGDNQMSFIDGIRAFISELKDNQLPLILDLRVNGGGNGNLPAQVLSVLAEEGVIYPGATSGFRMTSYMRQVQEPSFHQEVVGEDQSFGITMDEMKDFFQKTIDERRDYTPMFAAEVIPYDSVKVKGFNNKIVALVTANCISACDKMSFLLKSSGRATIIGTHSNGTGAGFLSTDELNTKWEDRLRVFETQVPNYLFGVPGKSFETTVFDDNSAETMCSENRPTIADVQYAPTMLDVTKNNIGWLQKAAQVIDSL